MMKAKQHDPVKIYHNNMKNPPRDKFCFKSIQLKDVKHWAFEPLHLARIISLKPIRKDVDLGNQYILSSVIEKEEFSPTVTKIYSQETHKSVII